MTKGHVLILVQNLPVPFDRRVWLESLALTEAGYEVTVISPAPPDDEELYRTIEGIRVRRYPQPRPSSGVTSYFREYSYSYWQTAALARSVWKERPFQAIHSCNPPDLFWPIGRMYRRRGVKYVFDQHDLVPELYLSKFGRRDPLYYLMKWLEARQYATADGVIATNESYRQVAVARGGVPSGDVTVVRSGPRLGDFYRVAPDPALKDGRRHLVVYLGVMNTQDGVDYALRAVRHAVERGAQAKFVFIGGGDVFHDLKELARDLDLGTDVRFAGRISDEDLKRYLSTADVALAPDPLNPLNDVSTMNKIIEYMAMGLPIVAFDLKEARVSAGDAAVYVTPNETTAFGDAIVALLDDPDRRAEMGKAGRQRFEQVLAWDHSSGILVRFYDRLRLSG